MKYLKYFESINFYNESWEHLLPKNLTIIKDGMHHEFIKGNVMLNADMIQITYYNDERDYPNTLEFDIYIITDGVTRIDIDITYGDLVVCEFGISHSDVNLIDDNTKFKSIFKFDDKSLQSLVDFLNKIDDVSITINSLAFLKN